MEKKTPQIKTSIHPLIKPPDMKVQFWIEQGLLPYLLQHNVPHTIIDRSEKSLRIEMLANGLNITNYGFAQKEFGMKDAYESAIKSIAA